MDRIGQVAVVIPVHNEQHLLPGPSLPCVPPPMFCRRTGRPLP
jgi:hypothetical protein